MYVPTYLLRIKPTRKVGTVLYDVLVAVSVHRYIDRY